MVVWSLFAVALAVMVLWVVEASGGNAGAEDPTRWPDERLDRCRHLNLRMTMPHYESKQAWEARAAWLREHLRVSTGLLPEPKRTPLNPQISSRLQRDGYTIEKVYIESLPGYYSTGNLYRPIGKKGPFPAVACPHGHWPTGRLAPDVQARCASLARLGFVVFVYDMVGYNDSGKQLGPHKDVFVEPQDELWGLSAMVLQSWNTLRAMDFLQSLPEVEGRRIGITGCSGGGTQTFMVMGIDDRVQAAAPVCMISGIMQGGCVCENAPLLRIETNNIEIAALMAPRPMIMPSVTGDWTRETPQHEYLAVRAIYDLYRAGENVTNPHVEGPHGYPQTHRESVYGFFGKHLRGEGDGGKIAEPAFAAEKDEDLLVWHGRELPKDAKTLATLRSYLIEEARRQRQELWPQKPQDRERFERTLGAAYRHAILAEMPEAEELTVEQGQSRSRDRVRITKLVLGRKAVGDRIPAVLYQPKKKGKACLVVHSAGKSALLDSSGKPCELLAALLASGQRVLAIDAYLTGEILASGAQQKKEGSFFSTYNRTPLVERIQDILTALAYLQKEPGQAADLIGLEDAGAWCLLAAPFTPEGTAVVADLKKLSGDEDARWLADLFTPVILKAGGPQTAAAIAAPRRLLLHNLAPTFDLTPIPAAYQAASAGEALAVRQESQEPPAILRWLKA